jgi:integrase
MLTAKRVERTTKPGRYRDGVVPGLYLQISETGAKSFVLRYQLNKQPERMLGIGPASTLTLKQARERARAARLLLLDGIDPIDHKRAAQAAAAAATAKALTFREAAHRYFDQHEAKWSSNSHRLQFLASLESHAFPVLGSMDVAAIGLPDILRCLEPIWNDKTITADRVRNRIEQILGWCTVRGHRAGDNPARWAGHLGEVLPSPRQVAPKVHHAALPYAALPSFTSNLRERDNEGIAPLALQFLILTASRTNEVLGARWDEIDFATATWTIPASRMKARREHRVPLSPAAVELLRKLPRENGNPFVFIGPTAGRGLGGMVLARFMKKRMGHTETVHGFRASFRTWSAAETAFPREVCERALAHVVGDQSEQAYERGDSFNKRRKLMDAWAKYCATPAVAKIGNVVGIGSR